MDNYYLTNATLVLPDRLVSDKTLVVRNGTISELAAALPVDPTLKLVDANGGFVVPGMVELHIHGCAEYGFDQHDSTVIEKAAGFLSSRGCNTFLVTTMCNESAIAHAAHQLFSGPTLRERVAGIYLEGPFVSAAKKGGIQLPYIRKPDIDYLKKLIDISQGMIRLMTVAPELEGIDKIVDYLLAHRITPCLGHSDCRVNQAQALLSRGRMNMTHLFNAMSPLSHQNPGLALLPFLERDVYFELNTDGVHVAPEMVDLCYRYLNCERLIIVSDAVVSAGREHGAYSYCNRNVVSDDHGVRYADDNTLIGSNRLVLDCVKNYLKITGAPLWQAFRAVTLNPCMLLGSDDKKGSIAVGKKADLLILDKDLSLRRNMMDC